MELKCKKCGKVSSNVNKFCDSCGGELEIVNKPRKKGVVRYILSILILLLGIGAIFNGYFVKGVTLILTGVSLLSVIYNTFISSIVSKNKFLSNLHIILPILFFLSFIVLNPLDDKIREMRTDKEKMSLYKEFTWPSSDIAKLINKPSSSKGKVYRESADGFSLEVSETSLKDFNNYVESCKEKGFTLDYNKSDEMYYAKNEIGYILSLNYDRKFNVMRITIDKPSEVKPSVPNNSDTIDESNVGSSSVREFLDSYEQIVNEYVDFIKKYKDSNYSSDMLSDYMKILKKYTEFADKASKLDQSEFSSDDLKYYLDVTKRITQKLSDI